MMIYLFPLLTIFWGGLFQSGLILYWAVYTAYLIVQQYTIMGWGNLFPIFGWRPRWAPPPTDVVPARKKPPDEDATREAGAGGDSQQPSSRPGGQSGATRQQQRPGRKRRGRRR
jgi:hypothetical protein